jgi:hypothetical protein
MRSRLAIAFLIVVSACLTFSATASACQDVNLVLPDRAGPGDTVPYSIAGISPGATYSFTIADQQVSGSNSSTDLNGVSGTFTMPDLGSKELTLTANGTCSCPEDANPQNINDSMQYVPPAPAAAPAPPASASSPAASAAPAPSAARSPNDRSHRSGPPEPVANHPSRGQGIQSAGTSPAVAPALGPSTSDASATSNSTSRSEGAKQEGKETSSVPDHVLHALGTTTSVGPAKVPTLGLLLMSVILVAGAALAAFVIYLFRNGPDPDAAVKAPAPPGPDPVDEELQQIIADEMARQLLRSLDLGEPTADQPDAEPALSSQHRT